MKIIIQNKQRTVDINQGFFKKVVERFIDLRLSKLKKYNLLEIYVSFLSLKKMQETNDIVFRHKRPTDVISIPIDTKKIEKKIPSIFGEIFICPKIAKDQSKEYGTTIKEEMTLLLVHGLLHLIGYDDVTDKDRKIMRREENKMMKLVRD